MLTATAAEPAAPVAPAAPHTPAMWRPVSGASTVAFRVGFGLLVAYSSARFLWRGWVGEFYLGAAHHLTFPRFEWVRPLPPPLMYAHVVALGVLGLAIAAGWRTRLCAALFAVGFAYLELIDAALYLNHYWYVTLAAVVLAVVPQPTSDAGHLVPGTRRPVTRSALIWPAGTPGAWHQMTGSVPAVTVWALRGQLAVVYVFAGIAKINTDWLLHGEPMRIWLAARTDRPLVGPWLDEQFVAIAMSWAGAAFDLTIVAFLLWPRTRRFAYVAVVCFHAATAALFQIGVFPWVMIALTPIFFRDDWCQVRNIPVIGDESRRTSGRLVSDTTRRSRRWVTGALCVLVAVNVMLPLRHYVAPGDVRFNDDGYYLSWRVMLTERAGFVRFHVTDAATGATWTVLPEDVLDEWQVPQATSRPDLILATAHLIGNESDQTLEVRAEAWVSVNGRPRQRWIDPDIDLTQVSRTAPANTYVLGFDPPVTG